MRRAARTGMSHEHTTPHPTLATQDIIWREVKKTQKPASKEPIGLWRVDGKRPDGVTSMLWSHEKLLAWDATVTDTYAASHTIQATSTSSGATAEKSVTNKTTKYCNLTATHLFIPIAVETSSVWCSESAQFIEELRKRITAITNEPLETT